jgi:hypothetical protein
MVWHQVVEAGAGQPVLERPIDLDLKFPDYRTAVPERKDFRTINPGYVVASD